MWRACPKNRGNSREMRVRPSRSISMSRWGIRIYIFDSGPFDAVIIDAGDVFHDRHKQKHIAMAEIR